MPLLPGKKNIGKNISELHKANPKRSQEQNIAIALHEAHIKPKAENGGLIQVRHDPYATPGDFTFQDSNDIDSKDYSVTG